MKIKIWKITKVFLQALLVIFLIVFLARINYLPVLFPDSWREWIIDTTDSFFEKQGLGKLSEVTQNILTLKFFDKNSRENELLVANGKRNFQNLLQEINENLNKITGSFEVLLSLSTTESEFNILRAKYYLDTLINNTPDYEGFFVWNANKKQFTVRAAAQGYNPDDNALSRMAETIDYDKLAQLSAPVVFFADKHLVMAYAFKGDTLEEKGILLTVLSNHFFERDMAVLRGKNFFNYVIVNKQVLYLRNNPEDTANYKIISSMIENEKFREYFTGQRGMLPQTGHRIAKTMLVLNNPLNNQRIEIHTGILYPKSVFVSVILNILLLFLLAFGIYVIIKMFVHLRFAYQTYRRLKEAPYLLMDDTLTRMSKVFDKMINSTKRIKTNVDRQRELTDKLLTIAPPKAIGYQEKKETKETYGFATEEAPDEKKDNSA